MSKFKGFLSSLSLKKLLYNKKFTIPFSFVMAFVLWLVIVNKENPIIERKFTDLTATVNIENTVADENGMSIIGDISAQKFTVVTRGPTYLVSSLKNEDFNLYASAASITEPGVYELEVTATPTSSNSGYEVLKVTPEKIKVSVDYIDTKEFTVEAIAEGVTPKEGLTVDKVIVSSTGSDTVTVTGPRTVLNKISKVVALAKVNKTLDVSKTYDAEIKLYDEKEKEISFDNLTLSATNVKVTVPISKKKTVPVEVAFDKLPEGFDKDSLEYELDTKTVTIIGKPEVVDGIKKVSLTPIDISKITKNSNSFDVSLQLPDGVRLFDNIEHFTVKFKVSNYIQKTIDLSKFEFKNLGGGLKAGGTKIKNVKIFGPRSAVYGLNSSDIYALIDLSNKKVGEYTLEVLISSKESKKVWAVGTYETAVTIKKK